MRIVASSVGDEAVLHLWGVGLTTLGGTVFAHHRRARRAVQSSKLAGRIQQKLTKAQGWARGTIAATLALTLAFAVLPMASAEETPDPVAITQAEDQKPSKAAEEPKAEEPKATEEPKAEEPKATEEPKAEEPKDEPKAEEPKAAEEPKDEPEATQPAEQEPTVPASDESEPGEAEAPSTDEPVVTEDETAQLRWRVIDTEGNVQPDTTLQLEGPAGLEAATVTDNTGDPDYDGADLDPAPGFFRVTQLTDDEDADNTHEVDTDETYQVIPTEAEGFIVGDDAEPQKLTSAAPTSDLIQDIIITPFATTSTMDVVVRKRVFANPSGVSSSVSTNTGSNYSRTAGTVFRLYNYTTNSTALGSAVSDSWATCEITSGGECTIEIPDANVTQTNGGNQGKRFWVVEETEAPGTYSNGSLYVGGATTVGGPEYLRRVAGLTQAVAGNLTNYLPMTGSSVTGGTVITTSELPGLSGSNNAQIAMGGSFGAVANSLDNPGIPLKCTNLSVAIVVDESGSIGQANWNSMRTAIAGTGAGSVMSVLQDKASVSILSFSNTVNWRYGQAAPVAVTSANRQAIYDSLASYAGNFTNWDGGLSAIENATTTYDLVLFVTDGAPNYILNGTGVDGSTVTLRSIEAPIYAANAIKAKGSRLVAVGVGNGVSGTRSAANLRAVSGTTPGSDYYQGGWDQLNAMLTEVVKTATCVVPIEVSKTTVNASGAIVDRAGGWNFSASRTGNGTLTVPTPASGTTAANGSVTWDLSFTNPAHVADLTLTENPTAAQTAAGWALTDVECTVNGVAVDVSVTNGAATIDNVKPNSGKVVCVFTNTIPPYQDLTVTKTATPAFDRDYDWTITKEVTPTSAKVTPGQTAAFNYTVTAAPSAPKNSGFRVTGNITVTNPNDVAVPVTLADALPGATCIITGGSSQSVPAKIGATNGTLTVGYSCSFAGTATPADATNTATATWSLTGTSGTASGTAPVSFTGVNPTITTDASTVVTDTAPEFATKYATVADRTASVPNGKVFTYTRNLTNSTAGQCTTHPNTATLTGIGQQTAPLSDNASVEVCSGEDLTIDKVVQQSLTRTYGWKIDKDVNETRLAVGPDGTATFDYTVTVTPQPYSDSLWAMSGTITVTNPNDWPVSGVTVTDAPTVGGGVVCSVTGGADVTFAAEETKVLPYVCTFTSAPDLEGKNVATVVWNQASAASPGATASKSVDIDEDDWSEASYNRVITVVDDKTTGTPVTLGTVDWYEVTADATKGVFTYQVTLDGPDPDSDLRCVSYTNTAMISELQLPDDQVVQVCAPEGEVTKDVVSTTQNADFSWTVVYDVVVTNESTTDVLYYDLTDAFDFGAGITIVDGSAEVSGPAGVSLNGGWDGVADTVVATGVSLAPTGSHTYVVTVDVNVAGGPDANLACSPSGSGGFHNTTGITFPGGSDTDDDCSSPASPTVRKVAKTATQDPVTGNWTVGYDVVVTNPSETQQLAYEATDTVAALPAGLSQVTGWSVSGPSEATGTSELVSPTWSGSGPFATGTLPAGDSHTYTVTGVVKVVGSTGLTCNDNNTGGVFNNATVTNRVDGDEDSACVSITPGAVTVAKSDGTVTQLADFSWQIDYTVTVNNASGVITTYTLTDTPDLGDGFDLTSGAWVGTAPTADKLIANGVTDTYTYRVLATFDPEVEDPELTCDPSNGGAFFNTVEVVYPGGSDDDTGCGQPASPTVTKVSKAAVPHAASGGWTVSYDVVVTNPSLTQQLAYEATDTAASLPAGLTLVTPWAIEGPAESTGTHVPVAWSGSGTFATGILPAGTSHTYTVTGVVAVTGAVTPGDLTCNPNNTGGLINNTTVTNGVGDDDDSACVSITPGAVTVAKSDGTVTQLADFSWQIDYTVTVNNASGVTTTYTLTDVPDLGDGFDLDSGTWVGTAPTADKVIANGVTDTYTYRVVATFDPEVEDPQLECSPTDGGAFFNRATVSFPGGTDSDTGCAEPASPTVTKTAQTATQNTTTGAWTLTYQVVVSNTSGIQLAYEATDTAAALPTGVTGGAWAATGPVKNPANAGTASLNASWAGHGDLATGLLPTGATHTYTVSRTVTVAATTPGSALTCSQTPGQGGGVWNSATVTNEVGGDSDDDCITITRPDVTIAKTVTNTKQLVDGTWQITYNVVATNTSSTLAAVYDLADTLEFGGDIVVNDASWTGPSGSSGDFTGATATLATNRVVAPSGVHTYVVTVNATVDADAWKGETLACEAGATPDAGGFLNTAELTVNGTTKPADDCSEPSLPTIVKTGTGAVQDSDDASLWLVSYELTVTAGAHDTFYALSDTPGFAAGITLGTGTAQRTDIAGEPVIDIEPGVTFVNDQELEAGETHTYTVTWEADLSASFDPKEAGQCSAEPSEGEGFFNSAALTVGDIDIDDDTCIPVEERVYPAVTKTETSTTQGADGRWTIVYDVVVSLEANEKGLGAEYNLTDTLNFGDGIEPTASWTGPSNPTPVDFVGNAATMATNKTIASGATHTYTVTAIAEVTTAAIEQETLTCRTGQTGPEAGGFLNTVLLTSGALEDTDFDCSQPDSPLVEKTGQAAVQDATTGEWTLTYKVVVTNPSEDKQLSYTLTDTPAALPTGVTLVGAWQVSGPETAGGGSGALTDGWNGDDQAEVATGLLPVGAVHTYTVTGKVKVAAAVPDSVLECEITEAGRTGVWNSTTVTNGAGTDDDEDCIPIDREGDVDIAKTVTGTAQLADGTWQITYDVVATNATEVVGVYSLTDTLEFGGDIVVNSASWTGPSSGTFAGDTATLATDVALGAGESHTYVVTVNATVDAEAWAGETLKCQAGEGGSSGGFLNTAELTVNGNPKEAEDCAEPSLPLIQKTGAGAVQDPTDASKWLVSYNIKVTGGENDTFYDLSDQPGFAAGITLGDGTAQRTDIGSQPVVPITSGAKFAIGVPLAASAVHTYVVTWIADVTDEFDPDSVDLQCSGENPHAGQAFYNAVRLFVGDVNIDDDTCIPVEQRVYPTVTKTATSTTQGSNSNWTIVYDVVVNLPANEKGLGAEYDLTDTLDFGDGITVIGATWTGPDSASGTFSGVNATLATDKTIASGATHTYTVTVVAAVSTASFVEETYQCQIGETGPETGGFLNTVLLSSGGQVSTDFDCTEPELPTAELPEEENPTAVLPFTGSDSGWLIGGALLAVLAGSGLLLIGRRRREGNVAR